MSLETLETFGQSDKKEKDKHDIVYNVWGFLDVTPEGVTCARRILPRIGPGSYPAFTIQSPLSPRLLLSPTFTMQRFNSLGLLLYVSQYKGRDVLLAPHTSQNLTITSSRTTTKFDFNPGP